MAWYRTSTINVTNGSTAVTGAATAWIANAAVGEALLAPDGKLYEIAAIVSNTSLTLGSVYLGSTQSAQAYVIVPSQSYIRDLAAQVATLVNGYAAVTTGAGAGKFGDGSLAVPGIQFSSDADTGIYRTTSNQLDVAAGAVRSASFTGTGINNTAIGATTVSTGAFSTLTTTGAVTIGGNLVVNGTTTTVNATTTTLDDPVITLGGDTAPAVDDNKDRGVEYRWHNGTTAKVGFFGFDDSTGKFTFIPDTTNTSEVFSGTAGPAAFGAMAVTTLDASSVITATGGLVAFDSSFSIKDNTDPTKIAQFAVDGLTAATTRIYTFPDLAGTLATSGSGSLNVPRNSDLGTAAYADLTGLLQTGAPVTVAAATYAVGSNEAWLIINYAGTHTITLPSAALYAGRCLTIKTLTANAVNSATSNVAPIGSATAGTAILAATAGKWACCVSDGSNWVVMEAN